MGSLFLAGGSEFTPCMREADLQLIELAGGFDAPVRIIPAAAAPDDNHIRAGNNGVRWFQSLGARDVEIVFVIDRASADDPAMSASLRSARLVYLLGGFPKHLGETLRNSLAWQSIGKSLQEGAVLAGSSAGAMVLCQTYYDPYAKEFLDGLDLLHEVCLIPHHNSSGKGWHAALRARLPDARLVGLDECTGILCRDSSDPSQWSVLGTGTVTLYPAASRAQDGRLYHQGQVFSIR